MGCMWALPGLYCLFDSQGNGVGVFQFERVFDLLISLPCAYLIGAIPFSYIIGRMNGVDLLKVGSGNPGATNLSRNLGKKIGAFGLILDLLKGVAPLLIARYYFWPEGNLPVIWAMCIGAAAVVGHCFSPFLLGKGGKGVATTAGVLIAYEPFLALVLLAFWGVMLRWIGSVGIASVVAALGGALLGATLMMQAFSLDFLLVNCSSAEYQRYATDQRQLGAALVLICLLIVIRHRQNIREYREARSGATE